MSKPPEFINIGRPLVPTTGGHEPAKSGNVRDKHVSHAKRNKHVENGSRGIDQGSPDSWKRPRIKSTIDGRNSGAGPFRTRGYIREVQGIAAGDGCRNYTTPVRYTGLK